jgi:hypothetical protein
MKLMTEFNEKNQLLWLRIFNDKSLNEGSSLTVIQNSTHKKISFKRIDCK